MPRSPSTSPHSSGSAARRQRFRPIGRPELPTETGALARYLLGKVLVREDSALGPCVGRIVETEAYVVDDAASHAFRGSTPRNRSMFLEAGFAYVYLIYGRSYCLNVSSETHGVGAAVLLRAAEPLAGLEAMRARRPGHSDRDLARGPGRLAAAFGIDLTFDGADLCEEAGLWLAGDGFVPGAIGASKRIGLTKEADRQLRFYLTGSRFLSGPKRLSP